MIDVDARDAPPPTRSARPQPSRRTWIALTTVVVLVIAGAFAAEVLVRHYRDAPALSCQCVLSWNSVDAPLVKTKEDADGGTDHTAAARTPARQAFYIGIVNNSSVTQSILGLSSDERALVYKPRLGISTRNLDGTGLVETDLHYTRGPASIPPQGAAYLRFDVRVVCQEAGSAVLWSDVGLRVRVGAFTRTERVGFNGAKMGFRGTAASSGCPNTR